MTTKRISPLQSLLLVSITVLLLIAIVAVHQSAGGTELSGSLDAHIQANPTDEVSLPIRAAPTETPTSRVTEPPAPQEAFQVKPTVAPPTGPGSFQANPTVPPPSDPGSFQANPTEPPTEDIDDIQVVPTEAPTEAIEDIQAIPAEPSPHIITVSKMACGEGVNPTDDYWAAIQECTEPAEGVAFSLTTEGGTLEGTTDETGTIEWTDVDLGDSGEIQIQETIPDGFGDPEVWCTSYPEAAGDPFDYEFISHAAENGLITASPERHEPYRFSCHVLNVTAGAESGTGGNIVRLEKRDCPLGVVEDAFLSDYLTICSQVHDGVEFTLVSDSGGGTQATDGGEVVWTDVSLGTFEIHETLPDGYKDPIVFCGFTESPGGGVQHPAQQDATGGVVSGSLDVDGAEFVCYWMNLKADPRADMEIEKTCPTVRPGAGLGDELTYQVTMTNTGTVTLYDIDVTESRDGSFDEPFPSELAPGESVTRTFTSTITQDDIDSGNVNNGVAVGAYGDVNASTTDLIVELSIECPLRSGPGSLTDAGGRSDGGDLVVRVWSCPDNVPAGALLSDYQRACDPFADGFDLTLSHAEGGSTELTSAGSVSWTDLPLGAFTIEASLPAQLGEPVVFCGWTAIHDGVVYDAFPQSVPSAGGVVDGEITVPNTHSFCDWMNVPSGPDDVSGHGAPVNAAGLTGAASRDRAEGASASN